MYFLSRLFGGEGRCRVVASKARFLSRLFGGEAQTIDVKVDGEFLSRLFGGEVSRSRGLHKILVSKPPIRR